MKSYLYRFSLLSVLLAGSLSAQSLPQDGPPDSPAWWWTRSVVDPAAAAGNTAPVNQGQVLHLAEQGIHELNTQLFSIGGAGFSLSDLLDADPPHYHAPANIGQLKHAASFFFDRFAAVGFAPGSSGWPTALSLDPGTGYPWAATVSAENLRPANIGQAKQLWSWDLSAWAGEDTDADALPDWWERYWFGDVSGVATDDRDGDGLSDQVEYLQASDPADADVNRDGLADGITVPGEVVLERWWIDPHGFRELAYVEGAQAAVPRDAVRLSELAWDAGPVLHPHSFGHRIRGYLVAPVSAVYNFSVSGDDFAEFWLSPDARSTRARRIAFNPGWNFKGAFTQYFGQRSLPQLLQAGQRYYFELYHYGDRINDHFAVGWQYAGMLEPEVVPASSLESFGHDPADLDGDALDDALEAATGLDPRAGFGAMGRFGDPDGDGFSNHWELLQGLDPLITNAYPAPSRSVLFPGVDDGAQLALDSWQLDLRGGHPGSDAFEQASTVYLAANGLDVGQYAYAHRSADRPVRLSARVRYHAAADSQAEAGLLLRSGPDSGAAFYRLSLAPDGRVLGTALQAGNAGQPERTDNQSLRSDAAAWLRLAWDGETLTADSSDDGQLWYPQGQTRIDLGGAPQFGLAVTSYDPLETVGAAFSDILIDWDSDADGLWDAEEQALGTDPDAADTDGDGLSDYEEVRHYNLNPLQPEVIQRGTLSIQSMDQAAQVLGHWAQNEFGELEVTDIAGKLELAFTLSASGIYELELPVRYRYRTSRDAGRELVIHHTIDGQYLETSQYYQAENNAVTVLKLQLPHLRAGEHRYSLHWENVYEGRSIAVGDVSLSEPTGLSGDALHDWQQDYIRATEQVLDWQPVTESSISPFYIEGHSKFVGMIEVSEGARVHRGAGRIWFTGFELPEDGQPTTFTIGFQQGGMTVEGQCRWIPTNVLAGGTIHLRAGDALRLTAGEVLDASAVRIEVGETVYQTTANAPIVHRFTAAGEYTLTASRDGQAGAMTVRVLAGSDRVDAPAVLRNRTRTWLWQGIDSAAQTVDAPGLPLIGQAATGAGMHLSLRPREVASPQYLSTRIGAAGPIVQALPTEGFWVRENVEGYYEERIVDAEINLGVSHLICSPLPEDVSLLIRIFKAGVMFEDGTVEKLLTNQDLDEFGRYELRMLKPRELLGSVCHQIYVYEGGNYVQRR